MAAGRDDRYFGLVRSQDEQPGRRFCEVLRTQDLPVTQAVLLPFNWRPPDAGNPADPGRMNIAPHTAAAA